MTFPDGKAGIAVLMEFTEVQPDENCRCLGCADRRRARLHAARAEDGGHPAARGARRAALLVATVGTVLGGAGSAIASPVPKISGTKVAPMTPQGVPSGMHGSAVPRTRAARAATTRAEIMARAQSWVDQQVPYSMSSYWSDGYRQDCSGFVSMAWDLGSSQTTWTLPDYADPISKSELQPGDILIYNNADNPEGGSHTVLFGGWTDGDHDRYIAYEQTRPHTLRRSTPYAYWSHSDSYVPYRYRGLADSSDDDAGGGTRSDGFPGAWRFGPGQANPYVKRLGEMLVQRGGGRFYSIGPDPEWGEADRRATEAFQLAQGWTGSEADGYPGRDTWDYLVHGKGADIPPADGRSSPPPQQSVPPFPGADRFGPGHVNDYVRQLGEQLVRKGYGRYYSIGPDREWGEADRLNVQSFQQDQGWTGTDADGYPGPDTWRLLFG